MGTATGSFSCICCSRLSAFCPPSRQLRRRLGARTMVAGFAAGCLHTQDGKKLSWKTKSYDKNRKEKNSCKSPPTGNVNTLCIFPAVRTRWLGNNDLLCATVPGIKATRRLDRVRMPRQFSVNGDTTQMINSSTLGAKGTQEAQKLQIKSVVRDRLWTAFLSRQQYPAVWVVIRAAVPAEPWERKS